MQFCSFSIGPRFDTALTAHGESHYRWIVVVRVSRLLSAEIYVGGPKVSVVTKHRAADRRRSELVRMSEPHPGDGTLKKGSVTRTMDADPLNPKTRSALRNWPLFCAVKAYASLFVILIAR